ncbi:hypothetical protein [Streptomyces sp. NPDC057740]|uniref:hypothetical protein n=1 Tax=Streptomyces sp. NPDC057740 TaxID=3346234 RepID=UPI0036C93C8F
MTFPRHLADLPLLRPGGPGHDDELAGFQTGFAQRPDLVVPSCGTADVTAAVRTRPIGG